MGGQYGTGEEEGGREDGDGLRGWISKYEYERICGGRRGEKNDVGSSNSRELSIHYVVKSRSNQCQEAPAETLKAQLNEGAGVFGTAKSSWESESEKGWRNMH